MKVKKGVVFFLLITFSILGFGCSPINKQTVDNDVSTTSSSTSEVKLSKEYILGRWKSTEKDWPIEINIYANSETEQLQLDIIKPDTQDIETFKTVSGYSSFFDADNSQEYSFSIYENQLLMVLNYIQEYDPEQKPEDIPASAIRPWILEKVEDN